MPQWRNPPELKPSESRLAGPGGAAMEELIVVIVAAGTAGGLLCARHGAKTAVLAPSVLPVTREERHELHFC